jgi:hypothetical protein
MSKFRVVVQDQVVVRWYKPRNFLVIKNCLISLIAFDAIIAFAMLVATCCALCNLWSNIQYIH